MSYKKNRHGAHLFVFIAPALIIYVVFMIYPLFDSLRLGFYEKVDFSEIFIGLDNYLRLATNDRYRPLFQNAISNSFEFFIINMFVQNPIALMLAALLAKKTTGSALYRTLIFSPAVLSLVIVAFIWQLLLNPLWGISYDLMEAIGLREYAKPWLGLPETALVTLALISAWQFLGIPMMLYYAALISIPKELVDSAYVDGATDWQVFWMIKLPLILPIVGIVSLMTYIFNFSAFDVIYAVKGPLAGPNFSTDTMMTLFYRTFFGYEFQPANPYMGAAIAGTTTLILLVGILIYIYGWRNRVKTYEL